MGIDIVLILLRIESPSPKRCFVPSLVEIGPLANGYGGEDYLNLLMYFHYFVIISPWERWWSFNWTNLNPMLCAKFCWNWSSDSGEDDESMKSLQTDGQTTSERSRLSFQLTGTTTDIYYTCILYNSMCICFSTFER